MIFYCLTGCYHGNPLTRQEPVIIYKDEQIDYIQIDQQLKLVDNDRVEVENLIINLAAFVIVLQKVLRLTHKLCGAGARKSAQFGDFSAPTSGFQLKLMS